MWIKAENSDPIRPQRVIESGTRVIVNKNFKFIPATEERREHWEYETLEMSEDQYKIYQTFEEILAAQEDALIELAGIIAEV